MNKIILFGPNGQVGFELQQTLAPFGELICCDRAQVDLNDPIAIKNYLHNQSPTHIVNAAAYTAVDQAENDIEATYRVNAKAPEIMAKAAADLDAWLVHYSTDYVFDGAKSQPYLESDPVNPINVYGQSKAAGENAIRASGCNHMIVRTSWVYSARGKNFLKTILRLAQSHATLNIVHDQIGAPTSASLIAQITAQILQQPCSGTFHLTPTGETSWAGFAEYIIELSQLKTKILGISSEEYPSIAKRPSNSRLNSRALCEQFGIKLPGWEKELKRFFERADEPEYGF